MTSRIAMATHHETLVSYRDGRPLWRPILGQYAAPVVVGVGVWLLGVRLTSVGDLIGGLALVAGFLFALVIFVFELRMRVTSDPRAQVLRNLPVLIDQLFANTAYAVGVAVVACVGSIVVSVSMPHGADGASLGSEPWVSGALVAVCLHLVALIFTCLKRTRTAYSELIR